MHEAVDAQALVQRIKEQNDFVKQSLKRLSLREIEALRTSPRNGKQLTVGWSLAHALEHTALHVGHIQLTRQLWKKKYSKIG